MPRFFNAQSFWNQPIAASAAIDPRSAELLSFLHARDPRGLWTNAVKWTIPIYDAEASTPRRKVARKMRIDAATGHLQRSEAYLHPDHPLGHGPGFAEDAAAGLIPIPDHAKPDPQQDSHMVIVDWDSGWIWDMFSVRCDGEGNWSCQSGMKLRVDGSGVFNLDIFADVHNGESIHPYGPARAAGVPCCAGLILHDEIVAGRIEHKIAMATQASALQQFVYPPATWTDGGWEGGLPEGATIQLDPSFDISSLPPAARTVAGALQEYGAVNVDVCGGHVIYAQGLHGDPLGRSWDGLLTGESIVHIPLSNYRVLEMGTLIPKGMGHRKPDNVYAGTP